MSRLMETAEYWTLGLGIAVLPLGYRAKRPDGAALKQTGYIAHGAPAWQRLQAELPNEETLRVWFGGPQRNIGIVTGWQNLVVLDFDDRESYTTWLHWCRGAGDAAATVAECTHRVFSARGVHVYVGVEEPVRAFSVGNIDIKAAGGYVLAPPSIHPSGAAYMAESPWAPVVHVERLVDVFPFTQDARRCTPASAAPSGDKAGDTEQTAADPWCWREKTQRSSILEIKRRVSLLDLLPDARSTSGDARWWMARCPLHDDQHESLWIDNKNGLCGCLAGCTSKPLDVINLYQRLHGCDTAVAVRELVGPVPGLEGGAI